MDWNRLLRASGVLGMVGGAIAILFAFQRRMCAMGAGGECAPNVVYLVPGIGSVLVGVSLVVFVHHRSYSDSSPRAET